MAQHVLVSLILSVPLRCSWCDIYIARAVLKNTRTRLLCQTDKHSWCSTCIYSCAILVLLTAAVAVAATASSDECHTTLSSLYECFQGSLTEAMKATAILFFFTAVAASVFPNKRTIDFLELDIGIGVGDVLQYLYINAVVHEKDMQFLCLESEDITVVPFKVSLFMTFYWAVLYSINIYINLFLCSSL